MSTSNLRSDLSAPDNAIWFQRLAQQKHIADLYPDFRQITHAAEMLLRTDESIWSIWLFGSRARGTARRNSDWDIAFITSAYRKGKRMDLTFIPPIDCGLENIEINCVQIPVDVFFHKRLVRPHLAWAIAAEGIPLAQRQWRLPIHQPNEFFTMDFAEYYKHLSQIHNRLNHISTAFEFLSKEERVNLWNVQCDLLQDQTQAMAEGFIKAGCIQRGYEAFPRVHAFDEIASSVRVALRDEPFAALIEELNGESHLDHQVQYFTNVEPHRITNAITRFCRLCDALPRELQQHARAFRKNNDEEAISKLNDLARETAFELQIAQETLSGLRKPNVVTPSLGENTVARVEIAWKGVPDLQRAMLRTIRKLGLS